MSFLEAFGVVAIFTGVCKLLAFALVAVLRKLDR